MRDRIERLRASTEAESLTEVIRRALAIYERLIELSESEHDIVIRGKDGDEQTLMLVP